MQHIWRQYHILAWVRRETSQANPTAIAQWMHASRAAVPVPLQVGVGFVKGRMDASGRVCRGVVRMYLGWGGRYGSTSSSTRGGGQDYRSAYAWHWARHFTTAGGSGDDTSGDGKNNDNNDDNSNDDGSHSKSDADQSKTSKQFESDDVVSSHGDIPSSSDSDANGSDSISSPHSHIISSDDHHASANSMSADQSAKSLSPHNPSGTSIFSRHSPRRSALTQNTELPVIPLFRRPLFPGVIAPIVVQDSSVAEAFLAFKESGFSHAALFLHKDVGLQSFALNEGMHGNEDPVADSAMSEQERQANLQNNISALHRVGVMAEVLRIVPRSKGSIELTFLCHQRVRWIRMTKMSPLLTFEVEPLVEKRVDIQTQSVRAYSLAIVETLKELVQLGSFYKEQLELLLESVDMNNPYHLADLGACLTMADPQKLQEVLEETDLEERMSKTLALLKSELETIRVQRQINKQIEENVSKMQRKFFLTEQLKTIKKELGLERDEKETLLSKFRERLESKTLPESAANVINEEMTKLSSLEPSSSEFSVTRNYLDWLTLMPWGIFSEDLLQVQRAENILNRDHYGMDDVKQRILEFIAVSRLRGSVQGKILLLSGPPGVGKTSIGKSIAAALNRKFFRFSVGGLSDVAEIKGHRRTYVGAMPGKFIQALKSTQCSNPVIMIDEIDKLGRGYQGDPASALLEALDPEQNSSFVDHYLDTPVDLSRVLFIATANVLDTIPAPLFDRMDNIRLPGYVLDEKVQIASKYLVPHSLEECGMTRKDCFIVKQALEALARDYCREAGVRNLKQQVDKILRKVALERVRHESDGLLKEKEKAEEIPTSPIGSSGDAAESMVDISGDILLPNSSTSLLPKKIQSKTSTSNRIVIRKTDLEKYVGKPPFTADRIYLKPPPGVSTGLAWTSMGGAILHIETVPVGPAQGPGDDKGLQGMKATGQMGDVMKESCDIAYSYASTLLNSLQIDNKYFQQYRLHMHIPEGATPKDGPSAGVTMVTSLLSLAMGKAIVGDLGMTGEITLTGKVLPVGGIREKVVAAKRGGLTIVIMPEANQKDWDELPDFVKKGISARFVNHYDQVLPIVFEELNTKASKSRDKVVAVA